MLFMQKKIKIKFRPTAYYWRGFESLFIIPVNHSIYFINVFLTGAISKTDIYLPHDAASAAAVPSCFSPGGRGGWARK